MNQQKNADAENMGNHQIHGTSKFINNNGSKQEGVTKKSQEVALETIQNFRKERQKFDGDSYMTNEQRHAGTNGMSGALHDYFQNLFQQ